MPGEWRDRRLRELIEHTRDGEWGSDQPSAGRVEMLVVRGTDFARLRIGDLSEIPHRYIERGAAERKQLRADDVLIETAGGTREQSTGRTALVKPGHIRQAGVPLTCSSFARFIRFDRNKVEPAYMYWWLQSLHAAGVMEQHQVQHTGVARFQFTEFAENTAAPLPSLPTQRAVARILGALDDKIELNRKMNETLEQMARAIFKSWFVDFEPFRDKGMIDSELGKVPRGWEVVPVSDICKRIFSGGTPSTTRADYWGGCLPWLSSGETRDSFIVDTEKTITPLGAENSSTRLARAGSTVIAGAGQGHTRGQTSMLTFDSYINQSVVALEADRSRASDAYLFFGLERRYEEFRQVSDGHSSRGSLTTKLLGGLTIALPPQEVVGEFDREAAPAIRLITAALQQSRTLAAIRDALLPKLMSGEVRAEN